MLHPTRLTRILRTRLYVLDEDGEPDTGSPLTEQVLVALSVTPGEPAFIPPYGRPDLYDPGSGDEVAITSVTLLGEARRILKANEPQWCAAEAWVEAHVDELVKEAADCDRDDAERAAEMRAEQRAEDARRAA